jgi:ribonuclease HI
MELLAVIVGLEKLKIQKKVLVVSDSKYVVDSILKSGFWLGEKRF